MTNTRARKNRGRSTCSRAGSMSSTISATGATTNPGDDARNRVYIDGATPMLDDFVRVTTNAQGTAWQTGVVERITKDGRLMIGYCSSLREWPYLRLHGLDIPEEPCVCKLIERARPQRQIVHVRKVS